MAKIIYKQSGVNYQHLDPVKIKAQKAAAKTSLNLSHTPYSEITQSRGESAYVLDMGDHYLATITECLGTKALIADAMYQITGTHYYRALAQDTIAMAVNDILTVGAKPLTISAYWAAGDSDWFENKQRTNDLIKGWRHACDISGAVWGGGETPSLTGVINPTAIDLAASCVGIIKPKSRLTLGEKLNPGDRIIALESSGIHANGLSLARNIAATLTQGYATKIKGNLSLGAALLTPTVIFAPLIEQLFNSKIDIHYLTHITGHGWLKLMRHPSSLTYYIHTLPPVPEVLTFLTKKAGLSLKDAYITFNMGAGFVMFIPPNQAQQTLSISHEQGIRAYEIGQVKKGPKQIIIEPLHLTYDKKQLRLRV